MKKYDLSKIMTRAWELVKKEEMTISAGLKKAWKEARNVKEKFGKYAKVLKEEMEQYKGTAGYCESGSDYFYFRRWEKYGKKRIYVDDYKGRSVGYIDIATKEICNAYNHDAEREMQRFIEMYEF